ncbi:MAG TPA: hypothetical protein VMT27_09815 [Actinomycetes bacterium]|nr:hypothetical protein [Actinomycetes bacterium]
MTASPAANAAPVAPTYTDAQVAAVAEFDAKVDLWREADAAKATATVDVAYATVALCDAGIIVPLGGKRGSALFGLAEYAETISTKARPVSESNLIQWRNLGHALRAGVKPDGDVWADLYNSGAKVNSKAVTEVLKGTGRNKPTEARIAKAIQPTTPQRGNGNTTGTRKSPAAKAKADMATALDMLAKALPNLSAAEFAKVPDALAKVVREAAKARAPKGAKAAKAA